MRWSTDRASRRSSGRLRGDEWVSEYACVCVCVKGRKKKASPWVISFLSRIWAELAATAVVAHTLTVESLMLLWGEDIFPRSDESTCEQQCVLNVPDSQIQTRFFCLLSFKFRRPSTSQVFNSTKYCPDIFWAPIRWLTTLKPVFLSRHIDKISCTSFSHSY